MAKIGEAWAELKLDTREFDRKLAQAERRLFVLRHADVIVLTWVAMVVVLSLVAGFLLGVALS